MVDKISRSIFLLIIILAVFSVAATYVRYVVLNDFEIINDIEEGDDESVELNEVNL